MARRPSARQLLAAIAVLGAVEAEESSLTLAPAGEPGARLVVVGTVVDHRGQPVPGARLHVYQTDASGRYTPERPLDEPHARLAGRLRTDARGRFELRTIRPGGYPQPLRLAGSDRKIPAHIHIDVTAAGHAPRKVQAVFADDPLLGDPYWRDWVERLQQPVLAIRSAGDSAEATLRIELPPPPPP